jgi:hypothetical protein
MSDRQEGPPFDGERDQLHQDVGRGVLGGEDIDWESLHFRGLSWPWWRGDACANDLVDSAFD